MNAPKFLDDDPRLICTLEARGVRAAAVCAHPRNKARYVPSSFTGIKEPESSEQEPSMESHVDTDLLDIEEDTEPGIQLTFDNLPKDLCKGFVLGSNPEMSDIFCGYPKKEYPIADRTSDIFLDDKGRLIYRHLTDKTFSRVQYNDQCVRDRKEFDWILFKDSDSIILTVAMKLHFNIRMLQHCENRAEHMRLRAEYLQKRKNALTARNQSLLTIQPTPEAARQILSRFQNPYYYRCPNSTLGEGTFGKVSVVRDVSDGRKIAAKTFFKEFSYDEAQLLQSLSHENIVRYVGQPFEDKRMLLMEFMKHGNLTSNLRARAFKPEEIATVLYQSLRALVYLHNLPRRVIHRDIKPDNILVECLEPCLRVRLGDFGRASQEATIRELVGTPAYIAPEAFSELPYDSLVDIWSLGVAILQCLLRGLPRHTQVRQGPPWAQDIVRTVRARKDQYSSLEQSLAEPSTTLRSQLFQFLADNMLEIDPQKRMSAAQCLEAGASTLFAHSIEDDRKLEASTLAHDCSDNDEDHDWDGEDDRMAAAGSADKAHSEDEEDESGETLHQCGAIVVKSLSGQPPEAQQYVTRANRGANAPLLSTKDQRVSAQEGLEAAATRMNGPPNGVQEKGNTANERGQAAATRAGNSKNTPSNNLPSPLNDQPAVVALQDSSYRQVKRHRSHSPLGGEQKRRKVSENDENQGLARQPSAPKPALKPKSKSQKPKRKPVVTEPRITRSKAKETGEELKEL